MALRVTKRDGTYGDLAATATTRYRATRRDGTFIDLYSPSATSVRVTRRDGTFYDLPLAGLGHVHAWGTLVRCGVCNLMVRICTSCGELSCGHTGGESW